MGTLRWFPQNLFPMNQSSIINNTIIILHIKCILVCIHKSKIILMKKKGNDVYLYAYYMAHSEPLLKLSIVLKIDGIMDEGNERSNRKDRFPRYKEVLTYFLKR